MKKTYAVRGMLDYQIDIPAGAARIKIHFSGGAFTKYGNLPACFATSDATIQKIIENSKPYREGRIYKM